MSTFKDLGVKKSFDKALKEMGIEVPTEIQEKTIPRLISAQTDFIGLAHTGTGKTAAFGLPLLQQIDPQKNSVQALILAPTRELAQQIKKQLFKFTKYQDEKIFIEAVYGGEKIDKQIARLKRPTHIIVATPGRLVDLMQRKVIDLNNVRTVVLDEADEMLSMGFKEELNKILSQVPTDKNIWLFSATMPQEVRKITKKYMDPKAIKTDIISNDLINKSISHQHYITTVKDKPDHLISFLYAHKGERGIIFDKTKAGVRNLYKKLIDNGFSVGLLEGDMSQKDREKVMRAFKNGNIQIMISTDVSARGIDVDDLQFVVHYRLPEQVSYYTHRSGRTARAGKKGLSFAFVLPSEKQQLQKIQKELGINFTRIKVL
jgi:ATP-dependent RNA helicase DeaD